MPLRRRVSWVAAAAVAIAVLIAAVVCYVVVRDQLLSQVDSELQAQAVAVQRGDFHALGQQLPGIPPSAGGPAQYFQIVGPGGVPVGGDISLPVDSRVQSVINGGMDSYITDVQVGGNHLRVLTFSAQVVAGGQPQSVAIQLARPLNGVDHVLSNLRVVLVLLCAGGVGLAAALGRLAARRALAPLAEVAETAQHISETEDLSSRIHVQHADDEVGQLATRFNAMMERLQRSRAELDDSVHAQRQLVADASHELRTPITSLRTNIEVLLADEELSEEDRHRLLSDVVEQSEELTALVGDLIELARGDLPVGAADEVRLDRVVEESVARARRNYQDVSFEAMLSPVVIDGMPDRLGRAVNNLLDNAARHSPAGGTVEVRVDASGVQVRDHGPGVAEEDLPHVFDRFYRGAHSRGSQGSGLGLAIVRQVAAQHGGSASAENAPGRGAVFTIRLPTVPVEQAHTAAVRPAEAEPRAPV